MDHVWIRLHKLLAAKSPLLLASLKPGATEQQIAQLETAIGQRLPDDLHRSLRRHDGQNRTGPIVGTLIPDGYWLLDLEEMQSTWNEHRAITEEVGSERDPQTPNPGVKPHFLHPAWIPVADDIGGNSYCVDLDPGDGGAAGQIIFFDHEKDNPTVVAASFEAWMTKFAADIESGEVLYDAQYDGFVTRQLYEQRRRR